MKLNLGLNSKEIQLIIMLNNLINENVDWKKFLRKLNLNSFNE